MFSLLKAKVSQIMKKSLKTYLIWAKVNENQQNGKHKLKNDNWKNFNGCWSEQILYKNFSQKVKRKALISSKA
jgi:hypothetical protein